jgi:hypothetical protein
MGRKRNKQRRIAQLSQEQIAAAHTRRPDWAWFSVNVGTDKPHKAKKGKGSYRRSGKHKSLAPET